jgi:hypothetical protein
MPAAHQLLDRLVTDAEALAEDQLRLVCPRCPPLRIAAHQSRIAAPRNPGQSSMRDARRPKCLAEEREGG